MIMALRRRFICRKITAKCVRFAQDQTLTSLSGSSSMMLAMMGSSGFEQFHALLANDALYKDQYDVKAGHWPENDHECVVIPDQDGQIYDMTLYSLGLKSGGGTGQDS